MPVSVKFGSGRQMSRVFPSHKNTSFLIVHTIISTSTRRGWSASVAYPGILFGGGGVEQIELRTEDRENGDLGAVAP